MSIPVMSDEMLSYTESRTFVKDQLQLNNCEYLLHTDRYQLLREITRRIQEHSPFHNFFLMAQDPDKRKTPSLEEIKSQMISGAGGLCYPRNVFTFYLLRALGFHVIFVMPDVLIPSQKDLKHVALVVKEVKQAGDRYLVDVGISWPCLEPVDLSFDLETPEMVQSNFVIKYIKDKDKIVRLQHHTKEDTYSPLYEMYLDAWDLCQVADYMDIIYQLNDSQPNIIHQSLSCVQYDDKGQVNIIRDNVFKRDNDDNTGVKFSLDDDDALVDCILENFSGLSEIMVTKAVVNWRKAVCPQQSTHISTRI